MHSKITIMTWNQKKTVFPFFCLDCGLCSIIPRSIVRFIFSVQCHYVGSIFFGSAIQIHSNWCMWWMMINNACERHTKHTKLGLQIIIYLSYRFHKIIPHKGRYFGHFFAPYDWILRLRAKQMESKSESFTRIKKFKWILRCLCRTEIRWGQHNLKVLPPFYMFRIHRVFISNNIQFMLRIIFIINIAVR